MALLLLAQNTCPLFRDLRMIAHRVITLEAMPANELRQRNPATLRIAMAEAVKSSDVRNQFRRYICLLVICLE
jgi:hypothetical protein